MRDRFQVENRATTSQSNVAPFSTVGDTEGIPKTCLKFELVTPKSGNCNNYLPEEYQTCAPQLRNGSALSLLSDTPTG